MQGILNRNGLHSHMGIQSQLTETETNLRLMKTDLGEVRGIAGKVIEDAKEGGTQVSPNLHDSCNLKCGCITQNYFYSFDFITF